MTLFELMAVLSLDSSGFGKGLSTAQTMLKSFTVKAADATGRLIKNMVKTGYEYNKEIETLTMSFTTMTGSATKANQVIDRLKKMSLESPLQASDLAKTTQLLMQYDFEVDDAIDKMSMLSDVAQGNAQKMYSIGLAYGQMHSKGKVLTQDLRQMSEQGFNPLQQISESTGESMESLYERLEKGKISFDEITAAMEYATSEGGKYHNATKNQAKTIQGQLTTTQGLWNELVGGLMKPMTDQLGSKVLPSINDGISRIAEKLLGVTEDAENLSLPDVSSNISTWLDSVMQTWTDGIAEDSDTVQGLVDSFTANTDVLKSALQARIDALSGSDDPEAATKIAEAQAQIEEIEQLEARVEEILTAAQGKNFTDEQSSELQTIATRLSEISTSANGVTEATVTPWSKFADAMGDLAAVSIDGVVKGIEWIVENAGSIKNAFEKIGNSVSLLYGALDAVVHPMETIKTAWNEIVLGKHGEDWDKSLDVSLPGMQDGGQGGQSSRSGAGRNKEAVYLPDPEDFGLAATGASEISTNMESAATSTQSVVDKVKELQTAADEAGVSAIAIADAMEEAGGINEEFVSLLESLIEAQTESDNLSTSLSDVSEADSGIDGAGVASVGSAADYAKSKTMSLVGAVERLNAFDGKVINIGLNYSTSGNTGIPGRAVGIDYVPYNGYTAMLHEGEMVLTKLEAQRFRKNEEQGLNATSGSHGASASEIAAAVASALSSIGINIDGKRAGRLMQKQNMIAQNAYNRSIAQGVGL